MRNFTSASLILALVFSFLNVFPQKKYAYESVPKDPLNVRIYTLDNGLKVYMSVYKDAPRIQTAIAVKTGSKNDPADNTGLSHYLEHLMFKGSTNFSTMDYEQESVYLAQIEQLFEKYRQLIEPEERKEAYKIIDSISGIAATFAIANEYDKMMSALGVKGTNAYTSVEQTVYINDVPSNQFEKWLDIELDRFMNPVFRIFHTELETVYEEKNMSLDNDGRKISEALMSGLYPSHNYGQQTVLGSPEHLKNPSLVSLRDYYNSRYVPNNMAIVLSGDFDPDKVIKRIDETFGKMKSRTLTNYVPPIEKPIAKPVIKEVTGPDAENMMLGFRFPGSKSKEADLLTIIDNILSNSNAGLIDLNLVKQQKVLSAGSYVYSKADYSSHIFTAKPKNGQTLEDVKELLLQQIDLVKKGEFPDWLIPAIINNLKLSEIREMESNRARNSVMIHSFVHDISWADKLNRIKRLSAITKQDIMNFAMNNYSTNYVVVYKRTGTTEATDKVEKPQITPVKINRDAQSDFFKNLVARTAEPIEPVFLNYDRDIEKFKTNGGVEINYMYNDENPTFALYYIFDMGNNHNKKLGLALNYLEYLGTSDMKPAEVSEEFYKLASSFRVSSSDEQVYVTLTGLSENMEKSLALFEKLLVDVQPNAPALGNLVNDLLKKRADNKLSKNTILWSALYNYGMYGQKNPFTNILAEDELKAVKPEELTALIKSLTSYRHRILYYGSQKKEELLLVLNKHHKTPKSLKELPAETPFVEISNDKNKVYVVDYDMKQVDIIMLSKSDKYNAAMVPQINVFNEYFGAGMSSIVFQELREAKGLAYTAYGNYRTAARPDRSNYIITYIGTQNDKLPEATAGMYDLLNNMPESEKHFANARESVVEKIRTERITKASILFSYERAKKMGLTHDIRKDIFTKAPLLTLADVKNFQQKYLKDKNYTILILGNKEKLDMEALGKYGEIEFLTLKDIFGY
jgi:predicted Zn-dependent peptidase